jgi:hypothetical protein
MQKEECRLYVPHVLLFVYSSSELLVSGCPVTHAWAGSHIKISEKMRIQKVEEGSKPCSFQDKIEHN